MTTEDLCFIGELSFDDLGEIMFTRSFLQLASPTVSVSYSWEGALCECSISHTCCSPPASVDVANSSSIMCLSAVIVSQWLLCLYLHLLVHLPNISLGVWRFDFSMNC